MGWANILILSSWNVRVSSTLDKKENYYLDYYIQHLRVCSTLHGLSYCCPHTHPRKDYFITIFTMREWRLREGKQLAQGHTARNNESLALSSELLPGN